MALSSNRVLRCAWSAFLLTVMSLLLSFPSMASRSLRHFRHDNKRWVTVCLLSPPHHQRASWALPILIRRATVAAWPDFVECIAQQLISSRLECVCWYLSVTSTSLLPSRITVTPIAFQWAVALQLVALRRWQPCRLRCSVRQHQVTSTRRVSH